MQGVIDLSICWEKRKHVVFYIFYTLKKPFQFFLHYCSKLLTPGIVLCMICLKVHGEPLTKRCLIGALKKIKRCLVQGKGCALCISGKFKKFLGEYQHKLADFIYYKLPQPLDTWRKLKVYIRRSEDVLDVCWTSFVHSIYMPRGAVFHYCSNINFESATRKYFSYIFALQQMWLYVPVFVKFLKRTPDWWGRFTNTTYLLDFFINSTIRKFYISALFILHFFNRFEK